MNLYKTNGVERYQLCCSVHVFACV